MDESRDPRAGAHSALAPYLHFGQVSPVRIALAIGVARAPREAKEAFLEELVVRRELAANLALFNDRCDRYDGLPSWALTTLAAHARDPRPHRYGPADLEAARTHDPYWNAAMRAMRRDGFLHNHLRMYWGKKILEWSATPAEGFRTALALNNRWFLDGRDPNSLAGVAWVFGTHDRAWSERPIFGKIRYMNDAGLRREIRRRRVGRLGAAALGLTRTGGPPAPHGRRRKSSSTRAVQSGFSAVGMCPHSGMVHSSPRARPRIHASAHRIGSSRSFSPQTTSVG